MVRPACQCHTQADSEQSVQNAKRDIHPNALGDFQPLKDPWKALNMQLHPSACQLCTLSLEPMLLDTGK